MIFVKDIQRNYADRVGIPRNEMTSRCRERRYGHRRQEAMYLCRRLTKHSMPQIGRFFGGRDHTTVLHAIRSTEQRMGTCNKTRDWVRGFMEELDAARAVSIALTGL